jgi:hypothetical protein
MLDLATVTAGVAGPGPRTGVPAGVVVGAVAAGYDFVERNRRKSRN